MAGLIDNAVLLAAMNQTVKAINDLATTLAGLDFAPTVNVNQDCTPQVVVNCTCGGNAGSVIPSVPGDQGQTPPPGYTEPDPETTDRKCKVANLIHDQMDSLVDQLAVIDADQWGFIGFTVSMGLVGAIVGSLVPGAGTLIGAVAGVISGIALQLATGGVALDLTDLSTILSTNQEDLVNELYNATNVASARQAYLAVLAGGGAGAIEQEIISLALTNDLLNLLFFTLTEYESEIDGYTGTIDCTATQVTAWHFDIGCDGWEFVQGAGAEWRTFQGWDDETPAPDPSDTSDGYLRVTANKTANTPFFECAWERDVSEMDIIANTGDSFSVDCWYTSSDHSGAILTITYSDESTDLNYIPNFTAAGWQSLAVTVTAPNNGKTVTKLSMNLHTGDVSGQWVYGWDFARWVVA